MSTFPALFLGHGSPLNAIEENESTRDWQALAARLAPPRAILCVSAHWETRGPRVTSAAHPETIHDFHGFPRALFDVRYPARGDPELAARVADLLRPQDVRPDPHRGLDHGCWSVLRVMYPEADVPVLQLSLDRGRAPREHYELAARLAPLREEGVLVLGSGNLVHNLGDVDFASRGGRDWAVRFNDLLKRRIEAREHEKLLSYEQLSPDAHRAIPTPEHYLPLAYVLALQKADEPVSFLVDRIVLGSISMTSVLVGRLAA
jgi:4,5-DOPA dioxygenase extradiol